MFENIIRKNIQELTPYSSARSEHSSVAPVMLDANENPFDSGFGLNRYPSSSLVTLKEKIAALKGVQSSSIFLGNGSDEAIDLLIRICIEPYRDEMLICPPTYGMYRVQGEIHGARIVEVPLLADFGLDVPSVLGRVSENSKIMFLCSPNNPTGNSIPRSTLLKVLDGTECLVVVDEAYIDFSSAESSLGLIAEYPNLCVLQTFSKAWGLAGVRLGMLFGSQELITVVNRVKYPYNVNSLSEAYVSESLNDATRVKAQIVQICNEREGLRNALEALPTVRKVYPSEANFLLVSFFDANTTFNALRSEGIIVRNRNTELGCEGCLRITVGTPEENQKLINVIRRLER